MDVFLLLAAGSLGGFIAGLVGVGGGVIFGPVLFFYFQAQQIEDPVLTPLTLGTSLLCTFFAALSGTIAQKRMGAIDWRTAGMAGSIAALVATLMTVFVTTKSWYSKEEFQIVLGAVLVAVVLRTVLKEDKQGNSLSTADARRSPGLLAATGAGAGAIASAAGVGGGIVMVPAFNGLLRLPLKVAAGTSSAAITLITAVAVVVYAIQGLSADVPQVASGFVDFRTALFLGAPAIVTARLGVLVAHRVNVRWVRYSFALLAAVVAIQLIWNSISTL